MGFQEVLSGTTVVLLLMAALAFTGTKADPIRLCSEGYFYAGDDDDASCGKTMPRSYWTEEMGRSPVYSCYRYMAGSGFNDAYSECRLNKEAEVVAFEDECEARRFFRHVASSSSKKDDQEGGGTLTVLTSALYQPDIGRWSWLGSDLNKDPVVYDVQTTPDSVNQCLAVKGTWSKAKKDHDHDDDDDDDDDHDHDHDQDQDQDQEKLDIKLEWVAVACNSNVTFACEVRSRTVTMVTWFYTNWITVSLMFLVMVLVISLCLSAITHTKANSSRTSSNGSNQRMPYRIAEHRRTNPSSASPVNDEPPKYSDVAGVACHPAQAQAQAQGQAQDGRFDRYMGKGRELLGKIYLYKS